MQHADPFAKARRARQIRQFGIVGAVFLVAIAGFWWWNRQQVSTLVILDNPGQVAVGINGRQAETIADGNRIIVKLVPGRFRLELQKEGHMPYTGDLTLKPGETLRLRPVFTILPEGETVGGGTISFVRPVLDQNLLYYVGDSNRLFRYDLVERLDYAVTERSLTPITGVEWGKDDQVALVTKPDGVYLAEVPTYNFRSQVVRKVATSEMLSPVWDPNRDNRLAAAYFSTNGERRLVLTDRTFSSLDRKADLSQFTKPLLTWSSTSKYLAVREGATTTSDVWLYELATGSLRQLTTGGGVSAVRFSPDDTYVTVGGTAGELRVLKTSDGSGSSYPTAATVAQAAWYDAETFILPKPGNAGFQLVSIDGSAKDLPVTLSASPLVGIVYFAAKDTLVFYTDRTVFSVSLNE